MKHEEAFRSAKIQCFAERFFKNFTMLPLESCCSCLLRRRLSIMIYCERQSLPCRIWAVAGPGLVLYDCPELQAIAGFKKAVTVTLLTETESLAGSLCGVSRRNVECNISQL